MVLLARLVLAGVFGVAGIAKLADPEGARRAMLQFGVPGRLAGPVAGIFIWSELGVSVGLLFGSSARASALVALGLLIGFSAAVALNLVRGRRADCNCFGRLYSVPIAWSIQARNGLLACVAAFVAADGRFQWVLAGLGVLAMIVWVALGRRRRRDRAGDIAPRLSRVPPGRSAA